MDNQSRAECLPRLTGAAMIKPGLTSITFRQLTIEEIVRVTAESGLAGIEWGGDIHVPPGDPERARFARQTTETAGLEVSSYGSYMRLGRGDDFQPVLDSAIELGAPTIRIWAGEKGSNESSPEQFEAIAAEARLVGHRAAAAGIAIGLELHCGTLTDTVDSALRLIRRIDHPNVRLYWQPYNGATMDSALAALERLLPHVSNIHVFHWLPTGERRFLHEGKREWNAYFKKIHTLKGDRWALIEFTFGDAIESLRSDADALLRLISSRNNT
jgi:3-dehydroshikimate dehydratase